MKPGMTAGPAGSGARAGSLAMRLVVALAVLAGAGAWAGWFARERQRAIDCESNLHAIYAALELYEMDNGALPRLAFFPDEPQRADDSLRVLVERLGLNGDVCVCPSSPPVVRQTGLSYLWNAELSGKKLRDETPSRWMLIEVHALSEQVPPPHRGRYHVLYADGRVERMTDPPADLVRNR